MKLYTYNIQITEIFATAISKNREYKSEKLEKTEFVLNTVQYDPKVLFK